MPIYKPSELRQFLTEWEITPKKVFSQNFLIDGNIIRKIVEISQVHSNDLVLEIGPGPGSLTEVLLSSGARVIAVEKDTRLALALERLKKNHSHLEIFCEDILNFPISEKVNLCLENGSRGKIIANLPYHLTTPILVRLLPLHETFSTLTLMVQEEMARRMTALPGTKDYSSFTVFLNFFATSQYSFTVSSHCFYPKPKVKSAVITLALKPPPFVSDQTQFFLLTRTAFGHRRKMLRSSLRSLYSSEAIEKALHLLGLNPLARPEELAVNQFIQLFEILSRTNA